MRSADELTESALAVIERAYCMGAYRCAPLFSGGHDSLCAVHLASQHRSFQGVVYHINTGIGSKYTRKFVERVCDKFGWRLVVHKSPLTYEQCVRDHGFPGPAGHQYVYNRIKERGIRAIVKGSRAFSNATMLVTGSRSEESVRRMGHAAAIQVGEVHRNKKTGKVKRVNFNRIWTAPCHDWSKAEQAVYMDEHGLPVNKLKVALGLSGECFCGAFASPGERERIRQYAPDVDEEITRLEKLAESLGKPCVWGQRPPGRIAVEPTGPLCHGCDRRVQGVEFITAKGT